MQVRHAVVGAYNENCYLISEGENAILIDPGSEILKIQALLKDKKLKAILLTHHHHDHIGALEDVLKIYPVPVYDRSNLEERRYIIDGMKLDVIYTPGHTPDSVSYYFYEYGLMFVGDFIFKNSIGRCDLEGGDALDMQRSILKLKNFSERTVIYPGHGEFTKLSEEKKNNPYLRSIT